MDSLKKNVPNISVIIALVLMFFVAIMVARRPDPVTPTNLETKIKTAQIIIKNQIINAEVVSKSSEMYQGLSERQNLCESCGMLFKFSDSAERDFVMRKMNFPLDIIFINQGQIIKIAANLPPEDDQPKIVYSSDEPVDQVLEIKGGEASRYDLKVGDLVAVKLINNN